MKSVMIGIVAMLVLLGGLFVLTDESSSYMMHPATKSPAYVAPSGPDLSGLKIN